MGRSFVGFPTVVWEAGWIVILLRILVRKELVPQKTKEQHMCCSRESDDSDSKHPVQMDLRFKTNLLLTKALSPQIKEKQKNNTVPTSKIPEASLKKPQVVFSSIQIMQYLASGQKLQPEVEKLESLYSPGVSNEKPANNWPFHESDTWATLRKSRHMCITLIGHLIGFRLDDSGWIFRKISGRCCSLWNPKKTLFMTSTKLNQSQAATRCGRRFGADTLGPCAAPRRVPCVEGNW